MKKLIVFACALLLLSTALTSCSGTCEHCGESTFAFNQVGDDENGIKVCNTCIDKMRNNKLSFTFTCESCEKEIVGKKNQVEVDGETKIYCNTCAEK